MNLKFPSFWPRALGWLALISPCIQASPTRLEIDLANQGPEIPANFYGLMTEEINYSYDGGLYAELIRNRTFQDPETGASPRDPKPTVGGLPSHWSVLGAATAATNQIDPVNVALPINLRLSLSGGTGGIANHGYWGIPVKPSTTYTAAFYARANEGFKGSVVASLLTDDGDRIVGTAETKTLTEAWQKYTVILTTAADAPVTAKARFALTANGKGSIDFSFISLFPPTYNAAPNGLRPDLMKLMAEMHPAFIRLPGGNYLEGNRFSDRFAWKKMIGPADQRAGHMGCWGYRSSDGFGLPEFLLWCQQLGAEPVLGLFAGYTLNGDYVPGGSPEMDLYTKEALEEIEYVMGPADSEWGKRRAQDGFPEPFELNYVEIGNEDFFDRSGSYEERFAHMAKAIREKYPKLKIIASMPVTSFKADIVDDHLYANAGSMMRQWNRYDPGSGHPEGRKADGVKVFMGEWATQGGAPTPNMMSALGDAVFAMGLERNADDVIMQCYAPLLANVNPEDPAKGHPRGWQWSTNLIGYDALSAFGSPSYHVLAAFGKNKGDVVVHTTFDVPKVEKVLAANPRGLVGLGSYETRVEYTDVRVTDAEGKLLSEDTLTKDSKHWTSHRGTWTAEDGILRPKNPTSQSWTLAGDPSWTNYTVTLRARKRGGNEGFIIIWQAVDGENYRWWNLGGWGNTLSRCEVSENGGREPYGASTRFTVATDRWYDLKLEVNGRRARGYVDGKLVMDVADEPPPPVGFAFASASYIKSSGELVLKVVNSGETPLVTDIALRQGRGFGAGKAIVIAGAPSAINTLAEPRNVAPIEESLPATGPAFTRTFPPYSVTLLRLPVKR